MFAPTYIVKDEKDGAVQFKTAKLTFHYVFVRGTLEEVKLLCGQNNGFSLLIDRGSSERYAIIEDKAMDNFRNIANAYKNCLPYLPLQEIDLEAGDLVEVVKGDFPGLVGTYIPNAKSKTGNIILQVFNNVGTVAFNVKVSDVRVLEFSANSTRANDQIDAFLPTLFQALRYYNKKEYLPTSLAAKLTVFQGRMEIVRLNNRKLDARLQAMLYATNKILGHVDAARVAMEHYEKVKESVTNQWTEAANQLLLAVVANDIEALHKTFETIQSLSATSKTQHLILSEYTHYLSLQQQETN